MTFVSQSRSLFLQMIYLMCFDSSSTPRCSAGIIKSLRNVSLIKLIAVGGYLAVKYLKNRNVTHDTYHMLDPCIEPQKKIQEKLKLAITEVAKEHNLVAKWVNDEVGVYVVVGDHCKALFEHSHGSEYCIVDGRASYCLRSRVRMGLAVETKGIYYRKA